MQLKLNFKNMIASTAFIITGLLSLSSAQAEVVWDLSTPSGLLGTTQTYTAGGATISAAGFAGSFSSPTALFGKALGGDESGLGLANDPTNGEDEIFGVNFVVINMTGARTALHDRLLVHDG